MARYTLVLLIISVIGLISENVSSETPSVPCPSICECQVTFDLVKIDCTARDLTAVPLNVNWPTTYQLSIKFDNNQITSFTGFPAGLNVTELSFAHNKLTSIDEYAFSNLTNLRRLDLKNNQLTRSSFPKNAFRGISTVANFDQLSIERLDLSANKIHTLDKDAFDFIEGLLELILDENPLQQIDISLQTALASTEKLELLSLASTNLTQLPDGILNALMHLKSINLANNRFETVPIKALASARNLQNLNLNGNPIDHFNKHSFVGLDTLLTLDMSMLPQLTRISHHTFTPLHNMIKLTCAYNQHLTEIHPSAFIKISKPNGNSLKQVNFRGNALTSLPAGLLPWDELEYLDIQENPWICDCNMKWILPHFLEHLEQRNPTLVLGIRCDQPTELSGVSMVQAALDAHQFEQCVTPPKKEPRGQKSTSGDDDDDDDKKHKSSANGTSLLVAGILFIVLSVGVLGWLYYTSKTRKARSLVHYTKAPQTDFATIGHI